MTKNVFITGASRGIGKAIAEAFAKEGFHLYLVCKKNLSSMQLFAEQLSKQYTITAHCYAVDLSDTPSLETFLETLPAMDVIVSNAGISHVGLLTDMSLSEWNKIINVNLTSTFLICNKLAPAMIRKQSGKIILISSVWGSVGASMEVAYSTTKGGINSFTKALAKELAPSNVQVNAIACGLIDTDMNACFSEEELADVVAEIPADRMGRPEEAAALCVQLMQAPDYLTGQIISLDGGWI